MPEHALKGIPLLQARNKWGFSSGRLEVSVTASQGTEESLMPFASCSQDTARKRLPLEETKTGAGKGAAIPGAREAPEPWSRSIGSRSATAAAAHSSAKANGEALAAARLPHLSASLGECGAFSLGCQLTAGMELLGQKWSFLF